MCTKTRIPDPNAFSNTPSGLDVFVDFPPRRNVYTLTRLTPSENWQVVGNRGKTFDEENPTTEKFFSSREIARARASIFSNDEVYSQCCTCTHGSLEARSSGGNGDFPAQLEDGNLFCTKRLLAGEKCSFIRLSLSLFLRKCVCMRVRSRSRAGLKIAFSEVDRRIRSCFARLCCSAAASI